MRRQVAICFLAAICFSGVVASSEQHDGKLLNKQCKRAIPLMPWRANYRLSCTYLCQGWPFRFGNEPDGIPCGPVQPLIRTTNVCAGGLCVPAYIAERTFNLRNKTITNLRTSEGTTEEPTKLLLHSTTNFPKTSGVTRRKHYTPSERTQGTTGDAAVEMSTTSLRSASRSLCPFAGCVVLTAGDARGLREVGCRMQQQLSRFFCGSLRGAQVCDGLVA
uniref:Uncharacterized protein n=1 Tax=Amblyomma maculatum TaxID=34609 RepID=G3MSK7_AMBMU